MESADTFTDDYAHQACYIFKPSQTGDDIDNRPRKKRRVATEDAAQPTSSWPRLCAGREFERSAEARRTAFQGLWKMHEEHIVQAIVQRGDETILDNIIRYVQAEDGLAESLKTGLLVSGSDRSSQRHLLDKWEARQLEIGVAKTTVVSLHPGQASNLQTALKNVIRTSIEEYAGPDEYTAHIAANKRLIPMNFDLELLQRFVQKNRLHKIVIVILDVETFDIGVLSDLLSTLSSWTDRIPLAALLGIATTVELFESRLSKSVIRALDAKVFHLASETDHAYEVFKAVQNDSRTRLFIGPSTLGTLLEMIQDQSKTVESFLNIFKYVYMSHFFANPLSVLLSETEVGKDEVPLICETIRNTDSFRHHCDLLLEKGKTHHATVRQLLDDDHALIRAAEVTVKEGQEKMQRTTQALQIFQSLYVHLGLAPAPAFELEVQLYQSLSSFTSSEPFDALLSAIENLHSDALVTLLGQDSLKALEPTSHASQPSLLSITTALTNLHSSHSNTSIRSTHESSLLSTSAKISPHKHPNPKSTTVEQTYTNLLDSFCSLLTTYFTTSITDPTSLFLHEAFLYNHKSPLSSTLTPRPRYALERALDRPGDYLGCECCSQYLSGYGGEGGERSSRPPPSSILYTLLSEAGAVINVRDLWDAFRNVLVPSSSSHTTASDTIKSQAELLAENLDDEDDDDGDNPAVEATETDAAGNEKEMAERRALALFYRALAELKMLGLVKPSKKKPGVECIAKTTWKGL